MYGIRYTDIADSLVDPTLPHNRIDNELMGASAEFNGLTACHSVIDFYTRLPGILCRKISFDIRDDIKVAACAELHFLTDGDLICDRPGNFLFYTEDLLAKAIIKRVFISRNDLGGFSQGTLTDNLNRRCADEGPEGCGEGVADGTGWDLVLMGRMLYGSRDVLAETGGTSLPSKINVNFKSKIDMPDL